MILTSKIFGYEIPSPTIGHVLLLLVILIVILVAFIWIRYSASFRKYFLQTFTDITGRADAKLVTAFMTHGLVCFLLLIGAFFKDHWPPEWILISLLSFEGALLGLDVANTIFAPKDRIKNTEEEHGN